MRAHTRQNAERRIPLVSLLLWCKIVAMHCSSLVTVVRRQTKIQVLVIFKKLYILLPVSILMLYLMLDELIIFRIGDFHRRRCFYVG